MSLIGKTLNQRFYILKSLARGGMGHTYLAEDRGFKARHHCVVKHLSPTKQNLPYLDKIKVAFEQEAEILKKLSIHTNLIPKLIDYFEEDGELYLVLELIPGAPLSAELTAVKQLNEAATIKLLTQILTPVKYCHDEGLIHRDLKPDNIMRRREAGELVLIDFGLVKDMGAAIVTQHSYGGTPGYAPDEQATHGLPEPASDVYAAGMIAIQALTGISPHQLRRNPQTMGWDLNKYCQISAEFTQVLTKMSEYFAIHRYQNAGEALTAVGAIPLGGNTPPPDPTPVYPQPTPIPVPQPKPALIEDYLIKLRLKVHPIKTQIFNTNIGVSFLGFRILPDRIRVRNANLRRGKHRLKIRRSHLINGKISPEEYRQSTQSWIAHLNHADTWRLQQQLFVGLNLSR